MLKAYGLGVVKSPLFAKEVLEIMARMASHISGLLAEERKAGRLGRGEYVAMLFPTVGAVELAKCFLTADPMSPLWDLSKNDLPQETAPAVGYGILEVCLFHGLREAMHNNRQIAQAIGIPHADVVRKYAAITEIGERFFDEGFMSIDRDTALNGGDIFPAWEQQIIEFVRALSLRGPRHGNRLEATLFPSVFVDVMVSLLDNLRMVLGNNVIISQTALIQALLGQSYEKNY